MQASFAAVLSQELMSAGVAAIDSTDIYLLTEAQSVSVSDSSEALQIRDQIEFSATAKNLSSSYKEFAVDNSRPAENDSNLVTGWNEAGYIRRTAQGLEGEMSFNTESGAHVRIVAGDSEEIEVSILKDGFERRFGLTDFATLIELADNQEQSQSLDPLRAALSGQDEKENPISSAYDSSGSSRPLLYSRPFSPQTAAHKSTTVFACQI